MRNTRLGAKCKGKGGGLEVSGVAYAVRGEKLAARGYSQKGLGAGS